MLDRLADLGLMRSRRDLGNLPVGDPTCLDCREGEDWRRFAKADALFEAWGPPQGSPWSPFHRPTLFAALDSLQDKAFPGKLPGFAPGEAPRALPRWAGRGSALLLDLPGEIAVAYAALLASRGTHAPVVTLNNWPHETGLVRVDRALASLLHFVPWVATQRSSHERTAPPAFVLDAGRLGPRLPKPNDFDNRYYLLDSDLPSAAAFGRAGIERVVYVRWDGEWIPPEPARRTPAAQATGFPWGIANPKAVRGLDGQVEGDDLNRYLHELSKRIQVERASVSLAGWGFGEASPFNPAIRKTPFTTTKDPAFSGFRRSAAGGFGELVPEPSSGGG